LRQWQRRVFWYHTEEGHPILYDTKKPGVAIDAITGERIAPEQKVVSAKPDGKMSEAATEIAARQVANGDLSGLTNVGRGAQGDAKLTAIKNKGAEILMSEMGMSPKEAAKYMSDKVQEFKAAGIGKSAAARTGATREENLNIILRATEAAIPAALEASKNVYRIGWVPINQLIQKGQVIANNPELREWGMANLQLAEHWARAMNPTGVMRESDRDKALEFLSTTDGPQTYERAVRQLEKQIIREKNAVGKHVEGCIDIGRLGVHLDQVEKAPNRRMIRLLSIIETGHRKFVFGQALAEKLNMPFRLGEQRILGIFTPEQPKCRQRFLRLLLGPIKRLDPL